MNSQARSAASSKSGALAEKLPPGHRFPKNTDGSHIRKILAQTCMVLDRRGEPHAIVVRGIVPLVPKGAHNLVLDINRQTAKHGVRPGRQRSQRIEHELVGDVLASFRKGALIESGKS